MGASPPGLDRDARRRLLVALNAADSVPHEAALRLAREPAAWLTGADQAAARAAGTTAAAVGAGRKIARQAEAIYRAEERLAEEAGAAIVTRHDANYPRRLLELELPPAVLYRLGAIPTAPAVAIVGSRRADVYGLEVAERFAAELAAAGLVIVSGFAIGVDGAAHRGALAAGGSTVAVLGCGVDVLYPRSHRRLRPRVAARGALISELRMATSPEARWFPIRNRIIAALAVGTLVVRAAPRSGSLITARLALELGREVWAVPGNISDPRSAGTNSLIRDGAHPVQTPGDILETLPLAVQDRLAAATDPPTGDRPPPAAAAARLLAHLPAGASLTQDRLVALSGLPAQEVLAALLELELAGRVRRHPGPVFCRRE